MQSAIGSIVDAARWRITSPRAWRPSSAIKASAAIQEAENTFCQDTSKMIAQLNAIVQKGQCMEAGDAKQLQDQILKLLKGLHRTTAGPSAGASSGTNSRRR